jgi:class 3 adenylate cyclase/tetratricopeptide (TPR) repeat protein
VTVLFADVSGFTSISSRLDAEVVAGVMNDLWSRLDKVITDHGGRIDKHIGDAVMAVWGVAATAEDDPERAVRAGLAMQLELQRQDSGDRLAMRVGINTGPAHLGSVGASAEFTAMGDTVNVASRVQSLAPLGGVLITHDTYRHVRGVFDVESLDPAVLKGKAEPVQTYVVHGAKERAFRMPTRGVEGVETRMIGRADDLAVLRAEFDDVVDQPRARRVTIIGDAGVGKSRLLYEFENWIELHPARAHLFKGRALAIRRSAAFALMRDVLADRFGVLDSDPASAVADKLRSGLGPTLGPDEADLVGHWFGFDLRASNAVQRLLGSGQLATTARAHLFRYVESMATAAPVVIFLEDLHWADDESLALVGELVAHCADVHLLVVGVGRPALLERPDAERILDRPSVTLLLKPLGTAATHLLVQEVLQKAEPVADELTDLIVNRADGNAFYVEELVKMLIEDGVIETGELGDPWHVHIERLDPERVPATLTGVLQTRLDSLAPAERDALQRSSVVGRVFWDGTVATLGNDGIAATASALEVVRQREIILRQTRSSFDENVEYTFKHALLRDVAYETVLLRDRQRLHGLVASWIRDHAGERVAEFAGLIATHHKLAGNLAAAAELLCHAAATALDAGNSSAARRSLDEAFELWSEAAQAIPVSALTAMTEACLRAGDVDAAHRWNEEALQCTATPEERVAVLFFGSWIASERGEPDRERAMLAEAMPEAERQGGLLLVRVLTGLSWCEVVRGDTDAARAHADRAHELAEQLRHPIASRDVTGLLGAVAAMGGDIPGSLRYSIDALALAVEAGDLEGQALAHSNIGVARHLLGDVDGSHAEYQAALYHYGQAKALNRRLGRWLSDGRTAANMAQVHVRVGEDYAARRLIHEALTLVRRSGGTATLLFCVLAEADRRLVNGEGPSAVELIGLVRCHPALNKENEREIERILSRSALPSAVIEQALANGAREDFDTVVDRLVQELAGAL